MSKTAITPNEVIEAPAVFVTTKDIADSLMKAKEMQAQIAEFAEMCDAIEVVDDTSEKRLEETLTVLNKVVGKVDTRRKAAKAPYLAGGKLIDNAAAFITGKAEEIVLRGKNKLIAYRDLKRKENEAKQKKLEEAAAQNEAETSVKNDKLAMQINNIKVLEYEGIVRCNVTNTIEDLKAWHASYTAGTTTCLQPSVAPDFPHRVAEALQRLRDLKEERKAWFGSPMDPAVWKAIYDKAVEECKTQNNALLLEIGEKVNQQGQEIAIAATAAKIESEEIKPGRFKWKYELADFKAVPEDWKMVNPEMVKQFIEQNKTTLANGVIVNGIRFIREEIVVLK